MKKIISTTLFGVIFMLPQTVLGGTCTATVCSQDVANIVTPEIMGDTSCLSYSEFGFMTDYGRCYKGFTCNKCDTGYTRVKVTEHYQLCSEGVTYYICRKNSDPCEGCSGSVTIDLPDFPNYKAKGTKQCINNECITYYTYHCSTEAYGAYQATCVVSPTTGAVSNCSGCTACPTATNVYTDAARTTLAKGKVLLQLNQNDTTIDDCSLPKGTYYDASGTFDVTGHYAGGPTVVLGGGCPY